MNAFLKILDGSNTLDPIIRFTVEVNCSTILIVVCIGVLLFFTLKHM